MFSLFGDSDFTARLAPALMGTLDGRDAVLPARPARARRRRSRRPCCWRSGRRTSTSRASPARTSTSRRSRFALLVVVFRFLDRPRALPAGADRGADRARLRDQGDDVHHRLRRRSRSSRCCSGASATAAGDTLARGQVGRLGGLGVGAGGVRGRLHADVHGLPHQPVGAVGRPPRRDRLLARASTASAAAARSRTSTSSSCSAQEWPVLLLGLLGAVARVPAADGAARVPGVGVRAVAGDLLVGGREVRLARAAPAAAADPAGRPRGAGLWDARAADARQGRAGGRGGDRAATCRSRSWWVNVDHRADPRELLVSTQSSEEVKRVEPTRSQRDGDASDPKLSVTVDSAEGATFPYAWYFRDLDVGYLDLTTGQPAARHRRAGHDRGRPRAPGAARSAPTTAASSRSASGGCATTARCRSATGGAGSPERKPWNPTGGLPE